MKKNAHEKTRIAILGAGPIGVETALYALNRGYRVDIYEQSRPGAHLERWAHIRFFSPWALNRSAWGIAALRDAPGSPAIDPNDYPTGQQYLERYLRPLVERTRVGQCLQNPSRVVGVARKKRLKDELIGDPRRADGPFLLLLEEPGGRRYAEADIVIDTTGVYGQPNALGPGGLALLGEQKFSSRIERYIPDVFGADRDLYANKTTLVLGGGFSAATSAHLLSELRKKAPQTRVVWLIRRDAPPYHPIEGDSLPERLKIARFGNRAAAGGVAGIASGVGQLERLAGDPDAEHPMRAEIRRADGAQEWVEVDRVVANIGYRPDPDIYRELQIHQCYATEGPMALAASLLAAQGPGVDCLTQQSAGADTLRNPEPDFYILGAKSYARSSAFLLKLGFAQIEDVFEAISER